MTAPKTAKRLTQLLLALSVTTVLVACNTVKGVGRDIKSGGAALEDAASDIQDGL